MENSSTSIKKIIQYFMSGWMYRIFLLLLLFHLLSGVYLLLCWPQQEVLSKGFQDSCFRKTARSQNYKDENWK